MMDEGTQTDEDGEQSSTQPEARPLSAVLLGKCEVKRKWVDETCFEEDAHAEASIGHVGRPVGGQVRQKKCWRTTYKKGGASASRNTRGGPQQAAWKAWSWDSAPQHWEDASGNLFRLPPRTM